MTTETTDWRTDASKLAQEAQLAFWEQSDMNAAISKVQQAFELIGKNGGEGDVVFVAVLTVAADLALSSADPMSASALYLRAATICDSLGVAVERPDVCNLSARAWHGLAQCDEQLGFNERALERIDKAMEILSLVGETGQVLEMMMQQAERLQALD